MYLTMIFVFLFQISFGLHLNFGLAQLLRGLNIRNPELLHILNSQESKPTESKGTANVDTASDGSLLKNLGLSGNLKNSTGIIGSNLGDATKALEDVSENASKALKGSLEDILGNVDEKADEVLKEGLLEDTLEHVSEKVDEVLSGSSSGSNSEKASKASGAISLDNPLKDLPVKDGKLSLDSILEGVSEPGSEKTSKSVVDNILGDSLKSGKGKADESSDTSILKDLSHTLPKGGLEIISEKGGKALDPSTLKASLEKVAGKESKELNGGISGISEVVENIEGTLKGGIDPSALKASLGKVAGKESKELNGGISGISEAVENIEGTLKVGIDSSALKASLGKVAGKENKELNGVISGVSQAVKKVEGTLKGGIEEKVLGINQNLGISHDLTLGGKCPEKSLTGVPAVSTFVSIFRKGVQSSKLLTILFNMKGASPDQFSQFKYRYFADFFRKHGIMDATEISALSVRFIASYFEALIPDVLQEVYSSANAYLLFAKGILTNENADTLALANIKAIEESAESYEVICDCDFHRNFRALGEGNANFILSQIQISKSTAWELSFYYAHAWLLAAVDHGALRVLNVKK